jgi:hypothetical protein
MNQLIVLPDIIKTFNYLITKFHNQFIKLIKIRVSVAAFRNNCFEFRKQFEFLLDQKISQSK